MLGAIDATATIRCGAKIALIALIALLGMTAAGCSGSGRRPPALLGPRATHATSRPSSSDSSTTTSTAPAAEAADYRQWLARKRSQIDTAIRALPPRSSSVDAIQPQCNELLSLAQPGSPADGSPEPPPFQDARAVWADSWSAVTSGAVACLERDPGALTQLAGARLWFQHLLDLESSTGDVADLAPQGVQGRLRQASVSCDGDAGPYVEESGKPPLPVEDPVAGLVCDSAGGFTIEIDMWSTPAQRARALELISRVACLDGSRDPEVVAAGRWIVFASRAGASDLSTDHALTARIAAALGQAVTRLGCGPT